jgi:opine dehydrogenase
MRALGVESLNFLQWVHEVYGVNASDYFEAFQTIESYREIRAPTTIQMRYLTEDIPTGLVPLSSIGHHIGIPTPTIDSLIHLAELLLNTNFRVEGRTIEKLGIPESLLVPRIQRYMIEEAYDLSL